MIQIYNDFDDDLEDFSPIEEGKVRMYVCGPTVYDSPHLGHARSAVSFDLIRKYLEYRGYEVKFVMNYTDVDDKMIKRAYLRGISIQQLARQYIEEYETMQAALNIKDPTVKPRATEEIPAMIKFIETLEEKNFTYVANGSVYFDTSKVEGYKYYFRKETKKGEEEEDFSESDFAEEKRHAADFVLWKKQKPEEPAWDSPWGKGRPGWHIECSVMSMKYLGDTIDIHGGGKDLKRPHHQNEIAQSESATGQKFCHYWMHNGFLNIDDEKMSKSLGNFIPLTEMLEKFPGQLIRYYFIKHYYQRPMNFSMDKMEDAQISLKKIQDFYTQLQNYKSTPEDQMDSSDVANQHTIAENFDHQFFGAMDEDFNTAKAIGFLFAMINDFGAIMNTQNPLSDNIQVEILEKLEGIDTFFNCIIPEQKDLDELAQEWKDRFYTLVDAILDYRKQLKQEKQYEISDKIRAVLEEQDIQVDDQGNDYSWQIDV